MKNMLVFIGLVWFGLVPWSSGQTPSTLTVNTENPSVAALEVNQANAVTIPVYFKSGTNAYNLSGKTPFMFWAESQYVPPVITAQCTIVSAASGLVHFTFSAASLNLTNGTSSAIYGIGLANTPTTIRQGDFTIVPDPYASGVGAIPYTTNLMWSYMNWVGLPYFLTNVTILGVSGTGSVTLVDGEARLTFPQETDPYFTNSVAARIIAGKTNEWSVAFSWGNHGVAGYLTSEADLIALAALSTFTGSITEALNTEVTTRGSQYTALTQAIYQLSLDISSGGTGSLSKIQAAQLYATTGRVEQVAGSVDTLSGTVTTVQTGLQAQVDDVVADLSAAQGTLSTQSYTKAQSDARFAPTGDMAAVEADVATLQSGQTALSTQSYTKAESDSRFAPTGGVLTTETDPIFLSASNSFQRKGTKVAITNDSGDYMVAEWDTGAGYLRHEGGHTILHSDGDIVLSAAGNVRLDGGTDAIFTNGVFQGTFVGNGSGVTGVTANTLQGYTPDDFSPSGALTEETDTIATNALAILALKHSDATNKLETVFGWGDWHTNGFASISWVSNTFKSTLSNTYVMLIGGGGDLWEFNNIHGVSKLKYDDPAGGSIYLDERHIYGTDWWFEDQVWAKGVYLYSDDSLAYVSITATGGIRVGQNSFHQELSGDIWHDPTNTAVLGVVTVTSLARTDGVAVAWATNAPTLSQYTALLARVTAIENTNAWLYTQLTSGVALASVSWTGTTATLSANSLILSNAMTSAVAAVITTMTTNDVLLSNAMVVAVAGASVSWTSTTASLQSQFTNVDAVALNGVSGGGYMLFTQWQAINTNVVFGFYGTPAATNSSGVRNFLWYDDTTNMFFYYDSYKKWSRNAF